MLLIKLELNGDGDSVRGFLQVFLQEIRSHCPMDEVLIDYNADTKKTIVTARG